MCKSAFCSTALVAIVACTFRLDSSFSFMGVIKHTSADYPGYLRLGVMPLRAWDHQCFIDLLKKTAIQAMILKRYKKLLLVRVKGILLNIFVKKMKLKAAEAFLRGADRRRVATEQWQEVDYWSHAVDAHRKQLAEMQEASQLLNPDNPYWETSTAVQTMDKMWL
jgi:hypothetical protein